MKYILKAVSFFLLSLMYMEVVGEARNFKESDTLFVLKNEKIQLYFFKGEDQVVLRQIVNHLSGKIIEVSNDDFLIGLKGQENLSQSDFVFEDLIEETKDGNQKLIFTYKHENRDLELMISYSLGQDAFFARRQLELYTEEETLDLREVTAWKLDSLTSVSIRKRTHPNTHILYGDLMRTKVLDSLYFLNLPFGVWNSQQHTTIMRKVHFHLFIILDELSPISLHLSL